MKGTATWEYEETDTSWNPLYIALDNRHPGPYRRQAQVQAILDVDPDGHLAGIEILHALSPRKVAKPRKGLAALRKRPAKKQSQPVFTATCPRCASELKDLVPFQRRPCPSCAAESIPILLTSGA